ncbi:MAG: ornithine carbamoyltransferase [Gammaproteobacteria bacterium]|nr:ornithine carbamoyltransferase [Gammaproteobacteria bacterium]
MSVRHYLSENDLTREELLSILNRAEALRLEWEQGTPHPLFPHKTLAMIFEKSSTRTRVSFEAGMTQLGGHSIYLSPDGSHMGRGEPLEDTARVLSRMVDIVMIRTGAHDNVERFSEASSVPVINGLTDLLHPCQLLADMQTYQHHRGSIEGKTVAWIGDGNNVCNSYINAASLLGFKLHIAHPEGYSPDTELLEHAGDTVEISSSVTDAVAGANLVTTDVWSSMGHEAQQNERRAAFANYTVNDELMSQAAEDAVFMHCLPAHRGEEVEASVIDGPQSIVWDQAGNRLHAQKALIEFLLNQP